VIKHTRNGFVGVCRIVVTPAYLDDVGCTPVTVPLVECRFVHSFGTQCHITDDSIFTDALFRKNAAAAVRYVTLTHTNLCMVVTLGRKLAGHQSAPRIVGPFGSAVALYTRSSGRGV